MSRLEYIGPNYFPFSWMSPVKWPIISHALIRYSLVIWYEGSSCMLQIKLLQNKYEYPFLEQMHRRERFKELHSGCYNSISAPLLTLILCHAFLIDVGKHTGHSQTKQIVHEVIKPPHICQVISSNIQNLDWISSEETNAHYPRVKDFIGTNFSMTGKATRPFDCCELFYLYLTIDWWGLTHR